MWHLSPYRHQISIQTHPCKRYGKCRQQMGTKKIIQAKSLIPIQSALFIQIIRLSRQIPVACYAVIYHIFTEVSLWTKIFMKLCWSDIYFRRVSLSFLNKLIKSSGSWVGGLTKELKFTLLAAASYPRYHITTKRPYRSNTNKTT